MESQIYYETMNFNGELKVKVVYKNMTYIFNTCSEAIKFIKELEDANA